MDRLRRIAQRLDEHCYAHGCMLVNPSAAISPWPNFDVTRNRLLISRSSTRDLILFLYLGIPLELSRLEIYFSDTDLNGLESTGFVRITGGQVQPLRVVIPFHGLYFATDIPTFFPTARIDDPIYMGLDSFLLASLLPRGSGRALDLCCGTGIHAVLLAARGYEVTGSDIDPRAVQMSRVNAALNRVTDSTEFRQGDLLDQMDGLFDVIVTKPPCQAIPDEIEGYPMVGNGGPDGLRIARRILKDVNRHLAPGGRLATVLQVLGDDRTVPFAAELEALAALHSWRVRLFLTKRIPAKHRSIYWLPTPAGSLRKIELRGGRGWQSKAIPFSTMRFSTFSARPLPRSRWPRSGFLDTTRHTASKKGAYTSNSYSCFSRPAGHCPGFNRR